MSRNDDTIRDIERILDDVARPIGAPADLQDDPMTIDLRVTVKLEGGEGDGPGDYPACETPRRSMVRRGCRN